ncbi:MAG: hypothetical protein ACPHVV_00435 [Porticoccaceae bacterium]
MNTTWMKKNIGLIFIVVLFYGVSSIASAGLFHRGVILQKFNHTSSWGDADFDGIRNDVDPDDDNDGVPDKKDAFPYNRKESVDTDGDGIGNNADKDDDNDGVPDKKDAFPLDPSASKSFRYCLNQVLTPRAANNKSIFKYFVRTDPRCGFSQKEPDQSKVMPLGTDSDRDGVRDDVQEKIKAKFGKSTAVTNYTMDMAKSFQKVLSGALSHKQVNQQVAQINHLNECIQNKSNDSDAGLQFILPEQLNTVARTRAYLKAAAEAYDNAGPPVVKPCGNQASKAKNIAHTQWGGVLKSNSNARAKLNPPNLNGYDMFFINGVLSGEEQADETQEKLEQMLNQTTIKLEYNKNHMLGQFFDLWVHKVGEIRVDKTGTTGFWQLIRAVALPAENARKALYEWLDPDRDIGHWAEKDLKRMIQTAKTALNQNKKVVMVAHSEGNFFYRNIYKALNQWNSKKTQQCFAGIGFATPLSSKPGNYNYITSSNDKVINLVRKFWNSTLAASITVPKGYGGDLLGHSMQKTYLSHPIPLRRLKTKLNEATDQLDKSCKTCEDSEMAIWVANDNNARDDNFDLYINNKFLSYLNLGTDNCNGHFILPKKYNQFDKHDLSFHKDVTKEINGCIGSLGEDHSSKTYFSNNLPITKASSKYKVKLINKQNNHNANFGKIYSFQICPNPKNGKPVVRRILGSAAYSGYSGEDIDSFNFKTGKCLPCDDLGNTGNFPDNKVTVILKSGGRGYCTAKVKLNGEYKAFASSFGRTSALRLMPGHYELELYDFRSSCQIGVISRTVNLTVSLDEQQLAGVSFLFNKAYFVIPAVDSSNVP